MARRPGLSPPPYRNLGACKILADPPGTDICKLHYQQTSHFTKIISSLPSTAIFQTRKAALTRQKSATASIDPSPPSAHQNDHPNNLPPLPPPPFRTPPQGLGTRPLRTTNRNHLLPTRTPRSRTPLRKSIHLIHAPSPSTTHQPRIPLRKQSSLPVYSLIQNRYFAKLHLHLLLSRHNQVP